MKRILIIRLSSFGDIVHTKALLHPLKSALPDSRVSWLVRRDLEGTLVGDARIDEVITFDRSEGLFGLIKLAISLRNQFDIIYDAHNNIRSHIFRLFAVPLSKSRLITRSKDRIKRFLLFKFGINKYRSWPYKAMESYWLPIRDGLGLEGELVPSPWPQEAPQEYRDLLKERIVLVPATAWPMKSWPVEYYKKLVTLLPEKQFAILGGPNDHFCEEISEIDPKRIVNLAGKLSLSASCAFAAHAHYIVTADTGLQQVADYAGVNGISLIGPTAFGYSTMGTLKTLEVELPCRPCTKDGSGNCKREIYQECMTSITPEDVASEIRKSLG